MKRNVTPTSLFWWELVRYHLFTPKYGGGKRWLSWTQIFSPFFKSFKASFAVQSAVAYVYVSRWLWYFCCEVVSENVRFSTAAHIVHNEALSLSASNENFLRFLVASEELFNVVDLLDILLWQTQLQHCCWWGATAYAYGLSFAVVGPLLLASMTLWFLWIHLATWMHIKRPRQLAILEVDLRKPQNMWMTTYLEAKSQH